MKKKIGIVLTFLSCFQLATFGQRTGPDLPQRTVTLSVVQHLDFGQMLLPDNSSGGQVVINYLGTRTVTGDLLAYPADNYSQAILSFKLCPGRSINVQYSPTVNLTDNGGHSLSMSIDNIQVGSSLLTASGQSFSSNKGCNDLHYMKLGTTLDISGSYLTNPPGSYNGSFIVTVAYE